MRHIYFIDEILPWLDNGLAFQWLSPHLPLLSLLAGVQLSGGYKYTWLSASFQLSHSQPSAPETHYCSVWHILN